MRKLSIFLLVIIVFISGSSIKILASSHANDYNGIHYIGTYETTESQLSVVKVYINDVTKEIYDNNGWIYYTEIVPIKFLWITIFTINRYYIYEQKYVSVTNEKFDLFNDINSLIYVVAKLEDFAFEYMQNNNSLSNLQSENNRNATDLVLGYIRSFNSNYYNSAIFNSIAWAAVAGSVDVDFISYVNDNDYSSFTIKEYFASFCSVSDYNSSIHGFIDTSRLTANRLIDPLNAQSCENNEIDLIHMFATIDGTYNATNNYFSLSYEFQRDLSGWAADLQTFCKRDIDYLNEHIISKYIFHDSSNGCCNIPKELKNFINYQEGYNSNFYDNCDMLADIDAMNIAKLYLDADTHFIFPILISGQELLNDNLLSTCLMAYYTFAGNDNTCYYNRYRLFIESVAVDNFINEGSSLDKFKEKVYACLDLTESNSVIEDGCNLFSIPSVSYYFLKNYNNDSSLPSFANRIYVAELFIDYIYEMSTPPIIDYKDLIEIDCSSNLYEDYVSLDDNEIIRYPINVLCDTTYKIKASSQLNEINIILYNEDGTIYNDEPYVSVNGTINTFILDLDVGSYYLELYFVDESDGWDIEIEIGPYIQDNRREILLNQTTDVLEHMHDGISKYKFMRANGDYYNMQIIMESYDSEINPTCEVELINTYNNDTITYTLGNGEAQNNQYIYNIVFKADSLYMINMDFSSEDLLLSLCTATITNLDEISLDTLGTYEYEEDIVIGDKVNYWNVLQNSVYEITIEGSNLDDVLFVVLKKNGNNFINLYSELASGSYYLNTDFELNQGDEIYIGYLNGNGTGSYEFTIERAISNSFHLVTDIDNLHTVGSEVTLNNGSYGGTTIMQGFTRVCYLDIDCPYPNTRLDYYWYSSDESVAKVSTFGTVTATCLWQENVNSRQVTITAVYKYDYTVIGTIILTVYKDTSSINDITYLQYGMDVRDGGTISGTEVTSGLGSTISVTYNPTVTIHTNKTRLICLGLDSPTSSIQGYIWTSSNDYYAQVSSFGTIFANNSGTVTISGINKYNSRYRVSIIITII